MYVVVVVHGMHMYVQCVRVCIIIIICGYHVYKEVWNPSIGEPFVFINHGDEINSEKTLPLPKLEVFPNFRDGQEI